MVLDRSDVMVTVLFGGGALIVGLGLFLVLYFTELKQTVGPHQNMTVGEVVVKVLMLHMIAVMIFVMLLEVLDILAHSTDLKEGIQRTFEIDWFAFVDDIPDNQPDVKSMYVLLGYIRMITLYVLALGPLIIFMVVALKQAAMCHLDKNRGMQRSTPECFMSIIIPSVSILAILFVHLSIASVLFSGLISAYDGNYLYDKMVSVWRAIFGLA